MLCTAQTYWSPLLLSSQYIRRKKAMVINREQEIYLRCVAFPLLDTALDCRSDAFRIDFRVGRH